MDVGFPEGDGEAEAGSSNGDNCGDGIEPRGDPEAGDDPAGEEGVGDRVVPYTQQREDSGTDLVLGSNDRVHHGRGVPDKGDLVATGCSVSRPVSSPSLVQVGTRNGTKVNVVPQRIVDTGTLVGAVVEDRGGDGLANCRNGSLLVLQSMVGTKMQGNEVGSQVELGNFTASGVL